MPLVEASRSKSALPGRRVGWSRFGGCRREACWLEAAWSRGPGRSVATKARGRSATSPARSRSISAPGRSSPTASSTSSAGVRATSCSCSVSRRRSPFPAWPTSSGGWRTTLSGMPGTSRARAGRPDRGSSRCVDSAMVAPASPWRWCRPVGSSIVPISSISVSRRSKPNIACGGRRRRTPGPTIGGSPFARRAGRSTAWRPGAPAARASPSRGPRPCNSSRRRTSRTTSPSRWRGSVPRSRPSAPTSAVERPVG